MQKKSLLRICIWFCILFLIVRKGSDLAFGWVLREVFARGTGCEVSLRHPKLSFFPPSGTVENVIIRHRSEPLDSGFRARKVSIRLHTEKLLNKELMLSDLNIEGAKAASDGTDTGFIQTFAFLFPPDDPNAPKAQDSALLNWVKTWVFHLTTISIKSDDAPDQLVLAYRGQEFRWNQVDVGFVEQDSDPKKPYNLIATGSNFRFTPEGLKQLALGRFSGVGEIGLGKLLIRDAKSEVVAGSDLAHGSGLIVLKPPGGYQIAMSGEWKGDALKSVLTAFSIPGEQIPEAAKLQVNLGGEFLHPEAGGSVQLNFGPGAFSPGRKECGITQFSTDFYADTKLLSLKNLTVEDLIRDASLRLDLTPEKPIEASLTLALSPEKRWMRDCFAAVNGDEKAPQIALLKSLSDSESRVTLSGNLSEPNLKATLQSQLSTRNQALKSKIHAEAEWQGKVVKVFMEEHGVLPMIQTKSSTTEAAALDSRTHQTNFSRAVNSNVEVRMSYSLDSKEANIEKFQLRRFPTRRLLGRLGPVLDDALFDALLSFPDDQSLVDADLSGKFAPESRAHSMKGTFQASHLNVFGVPIDDLTLPLALQGTGLSLRGMRFGLLGGRILSDFDTDLKLGTIAGKAVIENVSLPELRPGETKKSALESEVNGKLRLSGSLSEPKYEGELSIETAYHKLANTLRRSSLRIVGNQSAVEAEGTLFNRETTLKLRWPLQAESAEKMRLSFRTVDFPIDYFLDEVDVENTAEDHSTLSGSLQYEGPPRSPLAGVGNLEISRFRIKQDKITIEQNGAVQANIQNGRLLFSNVRFRAGDKDLALTGSVDRLTGWQAQLAGKWELGTFGLDVGILEQVSGTLSMGLDITGPPDEPTLRGPVRLENGSLSLPLGQGIVGVNDLAIDAYFQGDSLDIRGIQGYSGGATIRGEGEWDNLFNVQERRLRIDVAFTHLALEPVDHLTLDLDGNLGIRKHGAAPLLLSGKLLLRTGEYENNIKLSQLLGAITKTITGVNETPRVRRLGSATDAEPALEFDLLFEAGGGFLVETNVVQAELRSSLRLTGDIDKPELEGRIEAADGTFGLQSKEFEIVTAQATFTPGHNSLDPQISILGETSVLSRSGEEQHVRLSIGGTLTNPEINLSSDGGLRQDEIQALVGLGTSIEALDFLKGGRKMRSFAELINPTSQVSLEERLSGLTKFSTVSIDSALSPTTGEFVPRLVAKRPLTQSIDLDIQSELGGNQLSSINIDYPLTPYLSLIAGWRNHPVAREVNKSSGSPYLGAHYRVTFPGFRLFSPEMTRTEVENIP